jgi:hypothetical protein
MAPLVRTLPVIRVITPATDDGWQVTYDIASQHGGLVITGLSISNTLQSATNFPRGGLRAQVARSLIRPGAARAEVSKERAQRRSRVLFSGAYVRVARAWAATRVPPKVAPARLSREQRLASVARVYVDARRAGAANPRSVVAKTFRWSLTKARDEIHAARCARPPLLTPAGPRGNAGGGGELTPDAVELLEALRTQHGSKKPKGR